MKRKKWTEEEEETLINKYSELLNSGTLPKLKTREKKFQPIAEHVNSVHHLQDPVNFPFRWSWRDVSIKVQNMRHQYIGVKQKIRVSDGDFNWKDGEDHWKNFLKYKEVFGDVEIEVKDKGLGEDDGVFGYEGFVNGGDGSDVLGMGLGLDSEDLEGDEDEAREAGSDCEFGDDREDVEDSDLIGVKRLKKNTGGDWRSSRTFGLMSTQVSELRDMMVRREERRRERDFVREEEAMAREGGKRERENQKEERRSDRDEWMDVREFEWEESQRLWARREVERRLRVERELDEERRWRMKIEEKREEEEMEWRERMLSLQIEHEKQMMQMHADACQNQMQILGVLVRLVCQFFGSGNDGLGGGLGALPPQVLQNLQHPGSLVGDNGKTDANSPSHFIRL